MKPATNSRVCRLEAILILTTRGEMELVSRRPTAAARVDDLYSQTIKQRIRNRYWYVNPAQERGRNICRRSSTLSRTVLMMYALMSYCRFKFFALCALWSYPIRRTSFLSIGGYEFRWMIAKQLTPIICPTIKIKPTRLSPISSVPRGYFTVTLSLLVSRSTDYLPTEQCNKSFKY